MAGPCISVSSDFFHRCYAIAVVQVLSKTQQLASFFSRRVTSASDGPLLKEFHSLILELWKSSSSAVNASYFFDTVLRLNGDKFDEKKDHDAEEFLNFILQHLHDNLNVGIPQFADDDDSSNDEMITEAERADLQWSKHLAKEDSIVSDAFEGQMQSVRKCKDCSTEATKFDTFRTLSIQIPMVEEVVTLDTCMRRYCEEETFSEEYWPMCNKCSKKTEATKRMWIQRLPKIMIIHVKRFLKDVPKVTTTLSCPVVGLNMRPCSSSTSSNITQDSTIYDMLAVINHITTPQHYTAIIKHPVDGLWFCYDDHSVERAAVGAAICSKDIYLMFFQQRSSKVQQMEIDRQLHDFTGTSQGSTELRTVEDLQAFKAEQDNEPTIFGFFARGNSETAHLFHALSKSMSGAVRFTYTYSADILGNYTYKDDIVILRAKPLPEDVEPSRIAYPGACTLSDVTEWVNNSLHGLVGHRTRRNAAQFRKPLIIVCFNEQRLKTAPQLNKLRSRVVNVAKRFTGAGTNVHFAMSKTSDLSDELRRLNLTPSDKPVVAAVDAVDQKYIMEEKFCVKALESFASALLNGKLKPCLKSEPKPQKNDEPVKIVVRLTFDEVVNDKKKDVLIEFYDPSCDQCRSLAPMFEELAEKLKDEPDIVIAKMDATANDVPDPFKVSQLPAVYFAPIGLKNDPEEYTGSLKVDVLIEFLARESSSPLKTYKRDGTLRQKKGQKP